MAWQEKSLLPISFLLPLDSPAGVSIHEGCHLLVADKIKIALDRVFQTTGCYGKLDRAGRFSKIITLECMQ